MKLLTFVFSVLFVFNAHAGKQNIKVFGNIQWGDSYVQVCQKLFKKKLTPTVKIGWNEKKVASKKQCLDTLLSTYMQKLNKKVKGVKDPAEKAKQLDALVKKNFMEYTMADKKKSLYSEEPIYLKSEGVRLGSAVYDLTVELNANPGIAHAKKKLVMKPKNPHNITAPLWVKEVSLKLKSGDSAPVYKSLAKKYKFTNGSKTTDYAYGKTTKITWFTQSLTYSLVDDKTSIRLKKAYKDFIDNQAASGKQNMMDDL